MSRISRVCNLLMFLFLLNVIGFAGDDLGPTRDIMRNVLKNVSSQISKNFYDPTLKGLDWKALTAEARQKIDHAKSVNEMDAAIYELVEKLDDSHTFFVPPMSTVDAKYGFDVKPFGNEIRVFDVDPKGAAAHAGLQVGDRVLQIQGYAAERDTIFRLLAFTRLLYSVSPLQVIVQRPGQQPQSIDIYPKVIRRAVVTAESQQFAALWALVLDNYDEWMKRSTFHYGVQDGIGYVEVRRFPAEGEEFLTALAKETKGSSALIVDLRDSPGGSVDTLLSFAGLFQDADSEIATTIDRKKTKPMKVRARRPYIGVPVFVLVDSTTASASEVLARHLQKSRKAVVIGDHTLGAVTEAQSFDGEVGAGMVTSYGMEIGTAKIVLADGEVLEKKGVTPDVKCIPTQEDMRERRDPCLGMALKMAKEATGKTPKLTTVSAPQ